MRTDNRPFWDDALNVILSQVPPAGLDFPASGTRASATDIPNVALEWMVTPAYPNGAWFGSVGFHANQASLDAVPTLYLATGSTAMVAGVQYTYGAVGWAKAGGGSSILPCFDSIEARDAAYPTPSLGQKIGLKRLCGNGYFEQMYNGIAWEIGAGQYMIRDLGPGGAGYALTATNTDAVVMATYTVPAGLIPDLALCLASISGKNDGVYVSGQDGYNFRIGGVSMASAVSNALNGFGAIAGSIQRIGSGCTVQSNSTSQVINKTIYALNLGASFVIELTAAGGAATNKLKILAASFQRGVV